MGLSEETRAERRKGVAARCQPRSAHLPTSWLALVQLGVDVHPSRSHDDLAQALDVEQQSANRATPRIRSRDSRVSTWYPFQCTRSRGRGPTKSSGASPRFRESSHQGTTLWWFHKPATCTP